MEKITKEQVTVIAEEAGFEHSGLLNPATIQLKQEVREMCANGACTQYGKCWSCPPGCGTLEACKELLEQYPYGILVQSTAELEDAFDAETMMETEALHKKRFFAMRDAMNRLTPDFLPLGAGCCTVCTSCTYPDSPCRFPEQKVSSMEAFGMLVMEVCQANGLSYYYGNNTISYTSCFLWK